MDDMDILLVGVIGIFLGAFIFSIPLFFVDELGDGVLIPRFVRVDTKQEEIGKWYFPLEPGIDWYCNESIVDTSKSIEGCFLDGDCPGNKVHACKVVLAECPYGYDDDEECFANIYRYYPVCFDEDSCKDYLFREAFEIYNEVCGRGDC